MLSISLLTGESPAKCRLLYYYRNGECLCPECVSIRDEGIGIDPGVADRVFEVFQSLHPSDEYSGTGIGLAFCERIIERHDGDIWVESDPGEGTTFSFTLPLAGETDE